MWHKIILYPPKRGFKPTHWAIGLTLYEQHIDCTTSSLNPYLKPNLTFHSAWNFNFYTHQPTKQMLQTNLQCELKTPFTHHFNITQSLIMHDWLCHFTQLFVSQSIIPVLSLNKSNNSRIKFKVDILVSLCIHEEITYQHGCCKKNMCCHLKQSNTLKGNGQTMVGTQRIVTITQTWILETWNRNHATIDGRS